MGNHHAEEDIEEAERRASEAERAVRATWDALPANQKMDALERRLAMINARAVRVLNQVGFGDVFADLRRELQVIVEHSRNYRSPL